MKQDIGHIIKYYRNKQNLTQAELAHGICSIPYLSKLENGKCEVSDEIEKLLCAKLKISPKELRLEKNEIENFKKVLYDFYTRIPATDNNYIQQEYDTLLKNFKHLNNPEVILLKELFQLRIFLKLYNKESAEQSYLKVTELKAYNSKTSEDYYLRICGLYHYIFGNLEKALDFYKRSEEKNHTNPEELHYQLALVYTKLEKVSLSNYYLHKAFVGFQDKMNYKFCMNCNIIMAVNYRKMGEYHKAIDYYEKILNSLPEKEHKTKAKIFHNLGLIYLELENPDKSCEMFEESLNNKPGDKNKTNTLYLLAQLYFSTGRVAEAKKVKNKGKKLSIKNNQEEYIIKFTVLEHQLTEQTSTNEFRQYMESVAIPFFKKKNEKKVLKDYLKLLAAHYETHNKYKTAYELIK